MVNPVLFYFWAHSEFDELTTQTFEDLVERADVLFLELVSRDLKLVSIIENDLNCFKKSHFSSKDSYVMSLTKGTNKRCVLERTLKPFFGEEDDFKTSNAFFEYDLDTAMRIKSDFLIKNLKFQNKREKDVAKQILVIPETTVVLIGTGHRNLERLVKKERPTEIHLPYPNCPVHYKIQMWEAFRRTQRIDRELYLRFQTECMVRKALNDNYNDLTSRIKSLVAHHYASFFTPEQVLDFKDHLYSFSGIVMIPTGDLFESYLKINDLSSVEEVLESIKA